MHKLTRNLVATAAILAAINAAAFAAKPLKVFIIAGDENVVGQGIISRQEEDGREATGTLADVISKQPRFAFLKGDDGKWITRDDVIVYDGHPLHNNTVSGGAPLQVSPSDCYGGQNIHEGFGPELMFGHLLGDALEERILVIRFGLVSKSYAPGIRSLAHDYQSPSSWAEGESSGNWDIIHFNFGVWDTARREHGVDPSMRVDGLNPTAVPIDRYEQNLRVLVEKMKKTGATLIWGTTTPFHPDLDPKWRQQDNIDYNRAAAKVMEENGVIINDLKAESLRLGYPKKADVHSTGDRGPVTLAVVEKALAERTTMAKPLPRILFIGDSTSGYYKYVRAALEGKAAVYKNPGNGEHSDNGVKRIDEWLNLDTYHLNGEEYRELVNCVEAVFENPQRFDPGYQGEELQLAGVVWFQGIADGKSPVKAAAYEKNLACLIRDLRQDLNAPKLPVVVAANRHGNLEAGRPAKLVHEAQVAVGDPAKYPEFAGNVATIDTTPFFRTQDQSPGFGRRHKKFDERFNSNAESFLLIGEAAGKAMISLLAK
jgi:hypothetical protein